MSWRNKFANFMYGRYGVDDLSKFMLLITFILCIVSMFVKTSIISSLILLLIVFTYFRMFSKNIYKRAAENEKYLQFMGRFRKNKNFGNNYGGYSRGYNGYGNGSNTYAQQKKIYKFFKCPGCSQKIRVPKGHGKIEIRCPKCNTKFIRRS